jgi:hypothetical protein
MPSTLEITPSKTGAKFRSKKRINKLLGKKQPVRMSTRSRVSSSDFGVDEEWSNISTLQDLKRKKKTRLDDLKSQDMMLMSA